MKVILILKKNTQELNFSEVVFLYTVTNVLLPLVNKENVLAYSKTGNSQVGNPRETEGGERQGQRRYHEPPGEARWERTGKATSHVTIPRFIDMS